MAWVPIVAALVSAYASQQSGSKAGEGMYEASQNQKRIAELQKKVYEKSEAEAEPFRRALYPQLLDILQSGGTDPSKLTNTPMYGALRNPLESQYSVARESLGSMQGGGALARALANLNIQRAESVGRIPGQLYDVARQEGMSLAGINLQAGPASLASAGQGYGQLAGMYGQQQQAAYGQLSQAGSSLGQVLYSQYLKGGSSPQTGGANYWSGRGNTLGQTDLYWGSGGGF